MELALQITYTTGFKRKIVLNWRESIPYPHHQVIHCISTFSLFSEAAKNK